MLLKPGQEGPMWFWKPHAHTLLPTHTQRNLYLSMHEQIILSGQASGALCVCVPSPLCCLPLNNPVCVCFADSRSGLATSNDRLQPAVQREIATLPCMCVCVCVCVRLDSWPAWSLEMKISSLKHWIEIRATEESLAFSLFRSWVCSCLFFFNFRVVWMSQDEWISVSGQVSYSPLTERETYTSGEKTACFLFLRNLLLYYTVLCLLCVCWVWIQA